MPGSSSSRMMALLPAMAGYFGVLAPTLAQNAQPNAAPVIRDIEGPAHALAGTTVSLRVEASDRDGSISSYGARFRSPSGPDVQDVRIEGNTITFTLPTHAVASTLTVTVSVTDNQGASASADYELPIHLLSASSRLRTILGSPTGRLPARREVHWVITGDGYTEEEQEKLVDDAVRLMREVLQAEPIAPYELAWSVHVLPVISEDSGIDMAPPGRGNDRVNDRLDTAFEAVLRCQDVRELICVNQHDVLIEVAREFPDYDFVLVLANTDRYGGAGGTEATAMVATNHPDSPRAVLHELGHAFAGLADEYENARAQCGPPRFDEALVPNVTQVTDTSQVKWRHWFEDAASVPLTRPDPEAEDDTVGLFEGAWCHPSGYYRPTWNSIMRSITGELGPVNAENWVLQIYRRMGVVLLTSPGQGPARPVEIRAGSCRTFSVTTPFPTISPPPNADDPRRAIQRVQWFEDGVERSTTPGEERFIEYCPSGPAGTTHEIRVRVTDATGIVRAPPPNPAHFERTWPVLVIPEF